MSLTSVTLGWGDARLQMCLPDVLGPLQQWVSGCDWGLGCVWGPWGAALEGVQCWGAGRRCSLSPGHLARGCTLQLCHFGSSAGNMLTWKGGKLEPVWGPPPSHGDWLAGAKGCRMGAGSREVAGPGAGGCQGCLGEVLENETSAPGLHGPLEPVRHTGDRVNDYGVWHRTIRSIQGGRSIPRSPPASLQLAKCYCLAGAFPYPTVFWS